MKIAAILIVKGTDDEAEHLERCLKSIVGHVDGIFLNLNHKKGQKISEAVNRVVRKFAEPDKPFLRTIQTVWEDNFAKARNENLAMVPSSFDWVIWLDTDDTVKNPKKIREVAEQSKGFDCIYVDYDYAHDDEGNITVRHMVGRLFRKNGSHGWNENTHIHETLIETRGVVQGMTKDFKIIHHNEGERQEQSFERNIKMLEQQLKGEAKDPDPRTFFYLANTYLDAGNTKEAKQLFEDYLKLSGWDQERSVALTKLGRIYLDEGDRTESRKYFAWAMAEDPSNPDPRVELGSLEASLEQWNKARLHLEYVEKMEKDLTTLERNPLNTTFRIHILLAECYLQMGGKNLDKAEKQAFKALKYKKNDPKVQEYAKMVSRINADRKQLQGIITRYKKKLDQGKKRAAKKILDAIPEHLADNPVVVKLRQAGKPFKWPKKSIVIMTGDTAIDEWGPWSLKDGIGGSEEAIIRLAPKLAQKGYKVVVYAKPGAFAGIYDGVMWRNFWEWSPKDHFDIFVAWRAPFIFDIKINARKSYLWLHDVMEAGEFTKHRLANLHKVIVLSKYHRSLFPMIPEEKIMLSGNGIDPETFETTISSSDVVMTKDNPGQLKKVGLETVIKRDPHKIFYGSSHVRGLAYLYEIWPEVKKAVPQATLDVYYGRESYDKVHKGNPERMKWMDDLMAKAKKLEGVTDHGKVGQKEIVQHMFESGVWAYPCPFPEIYCITAVKAQAAGCIPVSSNFAALNETVRYGFKLPMAQLKEGTPVGSGDEKFLKPFKEALIKALTLPEMNDNIRPNMMAWARTQSWESVARAWKQEFET